MNNILDRTIQISNELINYADSPNLNFYDFIEDKLQKLYKNSNLRIYFLEDTNYVQKVCIGKSKRDYIPDSSLINKLISSKEKTITVQTKNDGFLLNYTILSKLAIRESVFGFALLTLGEKPKKDIITSFENIINTISYKIKDYELNEVFKIQLKALQDAILEKEAMYQVVKKQHKKLAELDKAKSLFLANISHELRTPLNAIIGFSQALDSKIFGDLNDKQAEYIKDIQISGLHLLGMINEILDISKLEANAMKFSPVEINPNQAINEVINVLEPLYKNKKIEVKFNADFEGKILADYQKFQQILYNLMSNAIKFTDNNGKIEITSKSKAKNYILIIKDNGIGIEKKYHNKIFKKFVHVNNLYTKSQSSTGLGLTITKELVKLHNGKISLDSELNKGTTFTMEFKNIIL